MSSIHSSAVVEDGAQLGENVEIGPFCFVAATAVIGDGCRLLPHATVLEWTTLGKRNMVYPGAVLGGAPQDLSYAGGKSGVVTGDDCTFREGVTVHRGAAPESVTQIGHRVYMMANSHAGHNAVVGDHVILANDALLGGYARVGDFSFCGGGCAVHQHTRIGRLAMIGGVTAVTKDVPPFCIVQAGGLNGVYGLNLIGLRRAGFSADDRKLLKALFGVLYLDGLNVTQAVEKIRAEFTEPLAMEFADFLAGSKRGIVRYVPGGDE